MRGDLENEDTLNRVRMALDKSVDELPQEVIRALRDRRLKAVALAERRERRLLSLPGWVTAGGVASLAILVVAVSLWIAPVGKQLPEHDLDELDLVTSGEQLELYEDLEFFLWLEERDNAG